MRVTDEVVPNTSSLTLALEMEDKMVCDVRCWVMENLPLHSYQVLPARLCAHPAACVWHGRERGLPPLDHWHAVCRPPQHQFSGVHLQLL